jgi:hypothetical protein
MTMTYDVSFYLGEFQRFLPISHCTVVQNKEILYEDHHDSCKLEIYDTLALYNGSFQKAYMSLFV